MQKQKKRYYTSRTNGITFTNANRVAVESIINISAMLELMIGDGVKPHTNRINIKINSRKGSSLGSNCPYGLMPILVQTAGSITDTVNITEGILENILDGVIDDELGYQKVSELRIAEVKNFGNATSYVINMRQQFDLPRNILNLLNKEASTERLQSLYLVIIVFNMADASMGVDVDTLLSVDFTEVSKGITIR